MLLETLDVRDVDGEPIRVSVMAYHNNGNGPFSAPWDVFYVDRLKGRGRGVAPELLNLDFTKRPTAKVIEERLHKERRAADAKDAAAIRGPRPRRKHSRDGQLRCEICAPLRCRRAP